jgi:hypothetical protein
LPKLCGPGRRYGSRWRRSSPGRCRMRCGAGSGRWFQCAGDRAEAGAGVTPAPAASRCRRSRKTRMGSGADTPFPAAHPATQTRGWGKTQAPRLQGAPAGCGTDPFPAQPLPQTACQLRKNRGRLCRSSNPRRGSNPREEGYIDLRISSKEKPHRTNLKRAMAEGERLWPSVPEMPSRHIGRNIRTVGTALGESPAFRTEFHLCHLAAGPGTDR